MAVKFLNRAMAEATALEMSRDEKVVLIGEDILNRGGGLSTFLGVPQQFPDRCFDAPIAELGYSHFGIGAALAGQRPIIDLMFSDFMGVAADAIINSAPKWRFNSLGILSVPIVFFAGNGGRATYGGVGSGCNHSQCVESWFANVPGLKIVAPYYADDAFGLLRASIRDDDPVLFLYHEGSLGKKADVPDDHYIPLNKAAKILREGTDVTLIAVQSMVPIAEKVAETLAEEGISVEVIDPRVLIPLDEEAIYKSAKKTGRVVVAHEAAVRGGFGGEIASLVAENCFESLKAPIKRVGALNSPIASGFAESFMMPNAESITEAVKSLFAYEK